MLQWSRGQGEQKNSGLRGARAISSWAISNPMTHSLPRGLYQRPETEGKQRLLITGTHVYLHKCAHSKTGSGLNNVLH